MPFPAFKLSLLVSKLRETKVRQDKSVSTPEATEQKSMKQLTLHKCLNPLIKNTKIPPVAIHAQTLPEVLEISTGNYAKTGVPAIDSSVTTITAVHTLDNTYKLGRKTRESRTAAQSSRNFRESRTSDRQHYRLKYNRRPFHEPFHVPYRTICSGRA